jgi:bromodomain and WD repeat domain-containing protein 1/3
LNGGSFTVKYHNVDGVPDFLVLKQFYDWAIRRDWQPGERFRSYRNDSWREGQIEMREPFSTHCPNSLFLCYRIRWENGEMERLSPWNLHETTKKPRGRPRSVNKVNMPGSTDCPDGASYKPQIVDWPPVGDMDFECDRISSGISKIMNLTAAKPFTAPVNLEAYPLYVFVVKYPPMDLSTVKSRLDNRFYRRLAAVQYDVRTICSNAYKFNEPKSDIVRNASIISDLCLEVIRNRDSTDAITSVYQQLVEKYKSQNDEVILENPVTSVAKECDQPVPTPRSVSRLNSPHSQPAEEINGIVTSKSKVSVCVSIWLKLIRFPCSRRRTFLPRDHTEMQRPVPSREASRLHLSPRLPEWIVPINPIIRWRFIPRILALVPSMSSWKIKSNI